MAYRVIMIEIYISFKLKYKMECDIQKQVVLEFLKFSKFIKKIGIFWKISSLPIILIIDIDRAFHLHFGMPDMSYWVSSDNP